MAQKLNTRTSVIDYLKSQKKGSSFADQKALAQQYGIQNYTGTAAQNTLLLDYVHGAKAAPQGTTNTASKAATGTANTQRQLSPLESLSQSSQQIAQQEQDLAQQTADIERERVQTGLAQEQERIEAGKAQVEAEFQQEASDADVARQQALNPYSLEREQIAQAGLGQGSGFEQSFVSRQFTNYQSRLSDSYAASQAAKSELDAQFAEAYASANEDLMNIAIQQATSQMQSILNQYNRQEDIIDRSIDQQQWQQEFNRKLREDDRDYSLALARVAATRDAALASAAPTFSSRGTTQPASNTTEQTSSINFDRKLANEQVEELGYVNTKQRYGDFITNAPYSSLEIFRKDGRLYVIDAQKNDLVDVTQDIQDSADLGGFKFGNTSGFGGGGGAAAGF